MSFFNPTTKFKADQQKSFEYAIYMIFGSYFGKTECKSPCKEASMHINYTETPANLLYEMEEFCDREAERLLSGRSFGPKTAFHPLETEVSNVGNGRGWRKFM